MIELRQDTLTFSFPEVHADAVLRVSFQRTLRIPDDERSYPLPPGLGNFPLRHVDDFQARVPETWLRHGGVMLPMYQSEALWINFRSPAGYPFALKVAAGKVNAVTGDAWSNELRDAPQDYVAIPRQPWLDGYCVEKGVIRQFVAMPLGAGYSAEEQLTGAAEHGGIQLVAYPVRAEVWERLRSRRYDRMMVMESMACVADAAPMFDMGLAPGGRMTQEIYDDPHGLSEWDRAHSSRCFVHLANSLVWREITGENPPTTPPTANEYTRAGLPWFEYYAEAPAVQGSERLRGLKSVFRLGKEKKEAPLPENAPVDPKNVVGIRAVREGETVREGSF